MSTTMIDASHDAAALSRVDQLGYLEIDSVTRGWLEEIADGRDPESFLATRAAALLAGRYGDIDAALIELDAYAEATGFATHSEYRIQHQLVEATMGAEADFRDARISIAQLRDRRIAAHVTAEHRRAELMYRNRGVDPALAA